MLKSLVWAGGHSSQHSTLSIIKCVGCLAGGRGFKGVSPADGFPIHRSVRTFPRHLAKSGYFTKTERGVLEVGNQRSNI